MRKIARPLGYISSSEYKKLFTIHADLKFSASGVQTERWQWYRSDKCLVTKVWLLYGFTHIKLCVMWWHECFYVAAKSVSWSVRVTDWSRRPNFTVCGQLKYDRPARPWYSVPTGWLINLSIMLAFIIINSLNSTVLFWNDVCTSEGSVTWSRYDYFALKFDV